eukprot:gene27011-35452_t
MSVSFIFSTLDLNVIEAFLFWSIVWVIVLLVPPGSREIVTAYRFNIVHGTISSIAAFLCLYDLLPETFTAMITVSYFTVDFCNNLLNDFVFKVKSYQPPAQRKVEYFHHIFCCLVGLVSQFYSKSMCTFKRNPFIKLMFAEVSTPFLMLWRIYPDNNIIGSLFLVVFIANRIIYHGIYFVPDCISSCNKIIAYCFGIPYDAMNVFFLFMISRKLIKNIRGGTSSKKET